MPRPSRHIFGCADTFLATPVSSRRADRLIRAFTLLEVLIVAGIIALLVAILIPSLNRAKLVTKKVTCMSNLRQWGEATHLYAAENKGYLPRRGQGVQPTNQVTRTDDWFNALPRMLHQPRYMDLITAKQIPRPGSPAAVWLCPDAIDFPGDYYWSYGMNMGLSVEEASQNSGHPDNISGVGTPSIMVLFADAPGNYCSVFPSRNTTAISNYNPVPRHNKSVNICFLDAHVQAMPGDYIGVGLGLIEHGDERWHPPGSTWNSAQ